MSEVTHRLRVVGLLLCLLRLPIVLGLLPFALLVASMKSLGGLGEWLEDVLHDIARSITMALNPKAWKLAKEIKKERDTYKAGYEFYKAECERSTTPSNLET